MTTVSAPPAAPAAAAPAAAAAAPWHASFPPPISKAVFLPRTTFLPLLQTKPSSYILVDLRRTDHTGGTIKTSLNLPAQTLHPSIPTLYSLAKATGSNSSSSSSGVEQIVFYCGSSAGRGSRAAAWMQDYIDQKGDTVLKSVALEGGIKGWVKEGGVYVENVDGYVESEWKTGGGAGGC